MFPYNIPSKYLSVINIIEEAYMEWAYGTRAYLHVLNDKFIKYSIFSQYEFYELLKREFDIDSVFLSEVTEAIFAIFYARKDALDNTLHFSNNNKLKSIEYCNIREEVDRSRYANNLVMCISEERENFYKAIYCILDYYSDTEGILEDDVNEQEINGVSSSESNN